MVVNRWRPDPTSDEGGDRVYISDDTAEVLGATPMPLPNRDDSCEFPSARTGSCTGVVTGRSAPSWSTTSHRRSDVVVRRLAVRNDGRRARHLGHQLHELVLGPPADDFAHPAFSKLFVHTEYLGDCEALIATRRRRAPEQAEMWAAHLFVVEHGQADPVHHETDRLRFLGRNGTARDPAQLRPAKCRQTTGDVLDPIFSLRQTLRVPGRGSARLLMWTMVAAPRQLLDLIDRHRGPGAYDRVAMLAWTQNQVRLRHLDISADEASQFQALGGLVMFPRPGLRPAASTLARDRGKQSVLWSLGVSGDLPIVLVRIDDPNDLHIVRQVVQAFEYWQGIRFAVDLVILNDRSSSYVESLQDGARAIP